MGAGMLAGVAARQALKRGNLKINEGIAKKIGEMLASGDVKQLKTVTQMATKSPGVLRLLGGIADEVGQIAGLSSGRPLEVTVRPGTGSMNLPAAADDEQR
jgi:hypothetical protein